MIGSREDLQHPAAVAERRVSDPVRQAQRERRVFEPHACHECQHRTAGEACEDAGRFGGEDGCTLAWTHGGTLAVGVVGRGRDLARTPVPANPTGSTTRPGRRRTRRRRSRYGRRAPRTGAAAKTGSVAGIAARRGRCRGWRSGSGTKCASMTRRPGRPGRTRSRSRGTRSSHRRRARRRARRGGTRTPAAARAAFERGAEGGSRSAGWRQAARECASPPSRDRSRHGPPKSRRS